MSTNSVVAILHFTVARLRAAALLQEAARLEHLPAHYRAQAEAAAKLAGMKLHTVYGQAASEDALALRGDVEDIARIVDPLIEAIGEEATANFNGIDADLFKAQLMGAIDGNATHALTAAADDLDESRDDTIAEMRREFQRAE